MIEHHPELQIAGLAHSTTSQTHAVQKRLTVLWNQAVDRHPRDARVLRHAASFFGFFGPLRDEQRQRELLERACAVDPKDVDALRALARLREHEARSGTKSAAAQAEDRRSAAALYESALDVNQDPERRVSVLNDVALAALGSGQLDRAERCAREALTALSSTPRATSGINATECSA
jgi:tetratricopeptide (TPR) repeat protein